MGNFNIKGITDLTHQESVIIMGGDPFTKELFRSLGIIYGYLVNAAEWVWDEASAPAPGNNDALLQTNALTLFS